MQSQRSLFLEVWSYEQTRLGHSREIPSPKGSPTASSELGTYHSKISTKSTRRKDGVRGTNGPDGDESNATGTFVIIAAAAFSGLHQNF